MSDFYLSIELLAAATDAGVAIEHRARNRDAWSTPSARPFVLIERHRERRFATAASLLRELHYLASLRVRVEASKAAPPRPTDTHAGRVEHAKANGTCFACRHYSLPLQSLSGFCKLGAPDWAHNGNNTIRWDNTCNRYEKD